MLSRSIVSDSWRPHGLQHTRPPCPSPTPWVYSNSCPLSQWCHPTISSSVIPFNLFQHQGLFKWVTSSHQVAKVLAFHLQHQSFPRIFGWISLKSKGLSRVFSNHSSKATILQHLAFFWSNPPIHTWLLDPYMTSYSSPRGLITTKNLSIKHQSSGLFEKSS